MAKLQELPNIGKVLEENLIKVGIYTSEQLIEVGSKEAFFRIKKLDSTACVNQLMALEGAIEGIRWHSLSKEVKEDLKKYFNSL